MMHLRLFSAVWGITLITSCLRETPKTGSISGDVFLLMQNGDVKHGAGNTVLLLGPADSVLATWGRTCTAYGEHLAAAARQRSNLTGEALARQLQLDRAFNPEEQLDTAFVHATKASSKTGVNAHYHFDRVPTGRYILWAETTIGDNSYSWWAPVTVAGGDSIIKDLDNSTEAHATLYCGQMFEHIRDSIVHITDSIAHITDSIANFATRARRGGWLRCMRLALATDRQLDCWRRFPVDTGWANQQQLLP